MDLGIHDRTDVAPWDIEQKKKVVREMLYETDADQFPTVIFGVPAYDYEHPELFVEFDTSEDDDYLGKAFIRWSAEKWLADYSVSRNLCDMCHTITTCTECPACEFDLSPFKFKGPCRFQQRESKWVCEDCYQQVEKYVEEAVNENPTHFLVREI